MDAVHEVAPIADMDIEANIYRMMRAYPPLMHDRHQVEISVKEGIVTVKGHVKSAVTHGFLLNMLSRAEGVQDVDVSGLYNDESIRLNVARHIPPGVMVNMEYGAVILSGHLPDNADVEALVKAVSEVPGVHRIVTAFSELN